MPTFNALPHERREFSLAELVAKISELERRRQAAREDRVAGREAPARREESESRAEPESTE